MITAVCPGSFDPITLGHLNIIRRASNVFDQVIVLVTYNVNKKNNMFTIEERVNMVERVVSRLGNVTVKKCDGLLAEFTKSLDNAIILKGLRAGMDFENEFQMAQVNKTIDPETETMFLASSVKYTFISSSIVREMAFYGADLSAYVPHEIISDIEAKARSWGANNV